jgi:hypothetical protein
MFFAGAIDLPSPSSLGERILVNNLCAFQKAVAKLENYIVAGTMDQ